MIKTYKDFNGPVYLELHDRHVWWEIDSFEGNEYELECIVDAYIHELEQSYKNLEVFCLGRSGRHVCIFNTPVNRRRYYAVQAKAEKLTDEMIQTLNQFGKEGQI